jgi:hypothetical protein
MSWKEALIVLAIVVVGAYVAGLIPDLVVANT